MLMGFGSEIIIILIQVEDIIIPIPRGGGSSRWSSFRSGQKPLCRERILTQLVVMKRMV